MTRFTVEIIVDEADELATRRAIEVLESKFAVEGGFDFSVDRNVKAVELVKL